jgi:hypothetical protein
MDYHSTMIQQQVKKEAEEGARRDTSNNYAPPARSPTTQPYRTPFSPTNGVFDNRAYHPPTPASLSIPPHIPGPPASPRTLAASSYANDFKPAPRENKYYDPTSDSIERPSEPPTWHETHQSTPQVSELSLGAFIYSLTFFPPESRALHLSAIFC